MYHIILYCRRTRFTERRPGRKSPRWGGGESCRHRKIGRARICGHTGTGHRGRDDFPAPDSHPWQQRVRKRKCEVVFPFATPRSPLATSYSLPRRWLRPQNEQASLPAAPTHACEGATVSTPGCTSRRPNACRWVKSSFGSIRNLDTLVYSWDYSTRN